MNLPVKKTKSRPAAESPQLQEFGASQQQRPMMAELYRQAEVWVRKHPRKKPLPGGPGGLSEDPRRLLHELQVHQVELEMQNSELQESRDRMEELLGKYTDLYDFAPVGYFSISEAGLIVEANLTGAAMLGLDRSKLLQQRVFGFISPAAQPAFREFLKRVFAGTRPQAGEALLVKAGGGLFSASFRATSAISLHGRQKWCRVAFVDVSERLKAETAMRESEKRYRTLFNLFPVAVYACDAAGAIENFNRRAAELWGREPVPGDHNERFCGSFKLFGADGGFIRHDQCPMADVLQGRQAEVLDREVIIQRPKGSRITVVVNIRPLKNDLGEITGAINCFYDITERKLAEAAHRRVEVLAASNRKLEREIEQRRAVESVLQETRRHQKKLLEQSRQMQERLRNLSRQVISAQEEERKRISRELHDVIGQTLTGINIRLAGLKKAAGFNTAGFERSITRTQELVEKAVDVVHQFARELRPAVLDDLGLIPALHSFLKSFTERTGVRIQLTAFADVEKLDIIKRTALFRVAQEALTNIERHARASRAEIVIQQLPDGVCLKIKDDGIAFDAERVGRSNGSKRLGLLGMRERLEMVGGAFDIESTPGQGTTVIARLPAPAAPPKTLSSSKKGENPTPGKL